MVSVCSNINMLLQTFNSPQQLGTVKKVPIQMFLKWIVCETFWMNDGAGHDENGMNRYALKWIVLHIAACNWIIYKYARHPTCMPYLNKRLHIMTNMSIEKSYIGDTRSNTKTTDKQNRQPGPQDVKSCESAFPFSKALLWNLFCHRPLETFSALWCPKPRFGRWRPLRNCVFEVELISF